MWYLAEALGGASLASYFWHFNIHFWLMLLILLLLLFCSLPVYLHFLKTQFLIQECVCLITKPNFISTLCYAIDNPLHYQKVISFVFRVPLSAFHFPEEPDFNHWTKSLNGCLFILQSLKPSPHLFTQLSKVLKLTKVQEVSISLRNLATYCCIFGEKTPKIELLYLLQVIFGLALLNSSSSDLRAFGEYGMELWRPCLNGCSTSHTKDQKSVCNET